MLLGIPLQLGKGQNKTCLLNEQVLVRENEFFRRLILGLGNATENGNENFAPCQIHVHVSPSKN